MLVACLVVQKVDVKVCSLVDRKVALMVVPLAVGTEWKSVDQMAVHLVAMLVH